MSSILTSVEGGVIGVGVGTAAAAAVEPTVEPAKQEVWHANPYRVLEPELLAELVAQALTTFDAAQDQAQRSGFDGNKFRALVEATFKGPPVAEALELWRRDKLTPAQMRHALHKSGIETQYVEPIMELFYGRLDPAIIATAIQRGIMKDPGFLPVGPPTGVGKVPRFPVSPLDTLAEAKAHGIDEERLFVETAIVGLPASAQQAASAYFRGIIELSDYYRAIAEGNTRNEWRDAILDQARQILTANQYAELELRGFLSKQQRRDATAKHGMSQEDSDHLFDVLGRSVNVHQIITGEARGGTYKPSSSFTLAEQEAGIPPAFLQSLQRGNLRPEYYNLAYHNRYTYPSFFAIRGLLTGGVLSADEGYQILLEMGWKPSLARTVADFYGVTTTAAGTKLGPRVKSAQTTAITEVRSAYLLGQADEAQVRGWLGRIDVEAAEIDGMLGVWNVMREVPQKGLTAPQIKKAFKSLPAQWPRDRALAELELLGLTPDDAATLLDE